MSVPNLKRYFPGPFNWCVFGATLHSTYELYATGWSTAWLGAALALWPITLNLIWLFSQKTSHTSNTMPHTWMPALFGVALTFLLEPAGTWLPAVYAIGIGLIANFLFIFWFSAFDREAPLFAIGETLPDFDLYDTKGNKFSSESLNRTAAIWLFYRGNWCPLCMAQIKLIAKKYRELRRLGLEIYLVSPQPALNTQALANRFDVPFRFLVDQDLSVARKLGIRHEDSVPFGTLGYQPDSVYPTVFITSAGGRIAFIDATDSYRIRPQPERLMEIVTKHRIVRSAQQAPAKMVQSSERVDKPARQVERRRWQPTE